MSGLDYGGGHSIGWRYSKPDSEGYTEPLVGTVLCYQLVQAVDMKSRIPRFFNDGNPIFNARIVVALQDGSIRSFTFTKANGAAWKGEKSSVHVELMKIAADRDDLLGKLVDMQEVAREASFDNIIGKTVAIQTQPEPGPYPPGTHYGANTPRPWTVTHVTNVGPFEPKVSIPPEYQQPELLAPMPKQNQGQPPMYGNFYQAPAPQPIVPPQPYGQPPMAPVGGQQPMPQQTPMTPAGMDPGVVAAMQQLGAQNIQQVPASPYDDSIPF